MCGCSPSRGASDYGGYITFAIPTVLEYIPATPGPSRSRATADVHVLSRSRFRLCALAVTSGSLHSRSGLCPSPPPPRRPQRAHTPGAHTPCVTVTHASTHTTESLTHHQHTTQDSHLAPLDLAVLLGTHHLHLANTAHDRRHHDVAFRAHDECTLARPVFGRRLHVAQRK